MTLQEDFVLLVLYRPHQNTARGCFAGFVDLLIFGGESHRLVQAAARPEQIGRAHV